MNVKTRFAPSPTGFLHIGGLRTAFYNYLFARKHEGKMVLRIEDTDQQRFVEGAIESLLCTLAAMGIIYDEGPFLRNAHLEQRGDQGPYIQSQRLEIYKKHAKQLVEAGKAYYCFCSSDRLDELRHQQEIIKISTKYDRHCFALSKEEVIKRLEQGESYVIRLLVPEGETSFEDVIRGKITIANQEVDDQVLLKSDGFPTYHLAVVIDDHYMEITHIIRGEEWISSVPKHILLYRAFGWELPIFAHVPLILNEDRSKLSKRQGDVAVEDYLAKGYLPEALLNFITLLGFNPKGDQEIYSVAELIEEFVLEKINKSGAIFNREKLDWMNGTYIRQLSDEQYLEYCRKFTPADISVDVEKLKRIYQIEKERLVRFDEIGTKIQEYQTLPEYEASLLLWKKADALDAKKHLEALFSLCQSSSEDIWQDLGLIEKAILQYIESTIIPKGNVLWPLRVALSGLQHSPSPFELLWVCGKEESLRRIQIALQKLVVS